MHLFPLHSVSPVRIVSDDTPVYLHKSCVRVRHKGYMLVWGVGSIFYFLTSLAAQRCSLLCSALLSLASMYYLRVFFYFMAFFLLPPVVPVGFIQVSVAFKEFMPWATVRVEDRDRTKNLARPNLSHMQESMSAANVDDGGIYVYVRMFVCMCVCSMHVCMYEYHVVISSVVLSPAYTKSALYFQTGVRYVCVYVRMYEVLD